MLSWLRRLRRVPAPVDAETWRSVVAELRLLDARAPAELQALKAHVEAFLAARSFTGTHGLAIDERIRLLIAAQACLLFLHVPLAHIGHWHEVIVYPGQFRVRRTHQDSDSEVVSEWDDELAGESWSHGPVILSWADVEQDLREPFEGFNVVIHEIAHKIDMADGASDGVPPIADRAQRSRWKSVMQSAFDRLAAAVERDEETVLDPYAAEAPDEFFAVASEYYFTAPDVLAEHYPAVYDEFRRFYGPVPHPKL